jgi:hypothetical protein
VAVAPDTLRTIHRPSLLIADVACPELSGRAGLECLLGRRAMSELPFDLELLAHRAWNLPTSSSLPDGTAHLLAPPPLGGARLPTLAAVRRFNHDTSVGSGR